MAQPVDRRTFHKAAGAAGITAAFGATRAQSQNVAGANGKLRIGVIGVGMRGSQLIQAILKHDDVQIVALCDVYGTHLEKAQTLLPSRVDSYGDFRKVLDRQDIDAVVLATPDHWHAIQTIMACEAGKDVYVEKPLSATIAEGRRMVDAARKHSRVVQVGTHRRSATIWKQAVEMVQSNQLGHPTFSRAARLSNMYPNGIGKLQPSDPPADLDWDMWLGPRAAIPYQANITPYKFPMVEAVLFANGQLGRSLLRCGALVPWRGDAHKRLCDGGGSSWSKTIEPSLTPPQVMYQFASGHLHSFGTLESSGNSLLPQGAEIEMRGSQGTLYVGGNNIRVLSERAGQFQEKGPRADGLDLTLKGGNLDQTAAHFRNFFDCIASRDRPAADVEIGHRSTTMALLANLSLATQSRLEWDAETETITNLPEANDLLDYEYRAPWKA